ncbi:MAG: hypothetical protein ACM33B_14860 [Pseudomonadota bacterium]
MVDTALFVGWGKTYPGREPFALKHYEEFIGILEKLKAEGLIERFEPVLLAPHGGDLDGFVLVYGEPDKLVVLRQREDLHDLQLRAMLDHAMFIVIEAFVGTAVAKQYALFEEIIPEYKREPALV